jgi:hypothetical protein
VLREHRAVEDSSRFFVGTEFQKRLAEPNINRARDRRSGLRKFDRVLKLFACFVEARQPT